MKIIIIKSSHSTNIDSTRVLCTVWAKEKRTESRLRSGNCNWANESYRDQVVGVWLWYDKWILSGAEKNA